MKTWTNLLLCLIALLSLNQAWAQGGFDPKIGGTLIYNDMKVGDDFSGRIELTLLKGGTPFAKTEVINPRFPQAYLIGPKNTVTPGMPFEGEFSLEATLKDLNGKKIASAQFTPVLAGARDIMLMLKKVATPTARQ